MQEEAARTANETVNNYTRALILAILELTESERRAANVQSRCQQIHCKFYFDEHDGHNISCRAIAASSGEANSGHLNMSTMAKYIHLYIYPIFILMGILGNSLSCFIMFINVRRSGFPTSLYLTLLAFVDCLFIVGSALPDWLSKLNKKLDIKHLSDFSCRFVYWFGHFTTHLSAGLVVGVTVERFIAVQYPLIAHKVNTVTHTRIVLAVLIIFFFLLDSPVFFLLKQSKDFVHIVSACDNDTQFHYLRNEMVSCAISNQRYKQTWVYVDFAVYTLIPFLIIGTLNALIVRRLVDAQRVRQRMFRFHNRTPRYEQSDVKHRHYSDGHETIELTGGQHRNLKHFRTAVETERLATMLRPQPSQPEDRRIRFNTKLSSISTELSTLSFELKARSNHRFEASSVRKKSLHRSNSSNTRLTILLLFVSCSFLALTLPAVLLNLYLSTRLDSSASTLYKVQTDSVTSDIASSHTVFYYTLARLLMIANHSINFILYFVLGKRFRRDLQQLFLGYWRGLYRRRRSSNK